MIGSTVSHYRILEKLGGGGMGVVYKAEDAKLKRTVALKFLPPTLTTDPEARARFIREAQAASALDHPNICTVHDVGDTDDGQTFIVMACYDGVSLKKKIDQGPLDIDLASDISIQIASGLSRAHEAGIIHRDIKPANIIITERGEAKIVDFGLAKLSGRTLLTKSGTTLGTASYMSPEQARGEDVDQRTDIWSLGVVMYEMLTGRRPFASDYEQALVYSILNENPVSLRKLRPDIPAAIEQVVLRAMSKIPDERYQNADEVLADLRLLKAGEEKGGMTQAALLVKKQKRKRLVVRLSAVGVLAALLVAAFLTLHPNTAEEALASSPKTIAVMNFENQTGDRGSDYLGGVLQVAIITSLEQSPYFRVTSRERMRGILNQMGRKDADSIDDQTGFEICSRDGAEAMVIGSFARAGELFVTNLKIVDVSTHQTLKTFKATGRGIESLLEVQIDDLCNKISRAFGVSERTTQKTLRPVAEMITNSLEAYDYYISGRREYDRYNFGEARRCFEKAVRIDSTFALAWWRLSLVLPDSPRKADAENRGRQWLQKTPEKERLHAEAHLYPERYWETIRSAIAKYPREKEFYACIATEGYVFRLRNFPEAVSQYRKALDLDPDYYWPLESLSMLYCALGLPDEALKYAQRYVTVDPQHPGANQLLGDAFFGVGNLQQAEAKYKDALRLSAELDFGTVFRNSYILALKEQYSQAAKFCEEPVRESASPGLRFVCSWWRGWLRGWLGMTQKALEEYRHAQDSPASDSAFIDFGKFWIYSGAGQFDSARACLQRNSDWFRNGPDSVERCALLSWNAFFSGMIALGQGRLDGAQERLTEMMTFADKTDEVTRGRRRHLGELLRAEILLSRDSADGAISCAAGAAPWKSYFDYSFNYVDQGMIVWNMAWSLRDVLARAYIKKGDLNNAIAEYERLTPPYPNTQRQFLIHPLYYYRLARLCEQKGLRKKAMEGYTKFLSVWKEADSTHPEPPDARKRLAKLRSG
jgi:tetratricopeptide (TPR) repeat protein